MESLEAEGYRKGEPLWIGLLLDDGVDAYPSASAQPFWSEAHFSAGYSTNFVV